MSSRRGLAGVARRLRCLPPLGLLGLTYAALRLWNLTLLPLSGDEAIDVYRALTRDLLPHLNEGRLFHLALYPLALRWAPDPAWVARFLSVAAGVATLYAVWRLSEEPENRCAGRWPAILYVFCPLTLFFDRVVLPETFLSMAGTLVLLSSWRFLRAPGAAAAVWLGLAMTLALTIKIPGLLFLPIPSLVVLFYGRKPLASCLKGLGLAYSFPLGALVALFLSGKGSAALAAIATALRNVSVSTASRPTLAVARGNFDSLVNWLSAFLTPPLFYICVAALVLSLLRRERFDYFWAAAGAVFALPFVASAQALFPHHLLFVAIPLFFLTGATLEGYREHLRFLEQRGTLPGPARWLLPPLLVVMFGYMLRFDYRILTGPEKAGLPPLDRATFITEWPGGYGGREVYDYLDAFARRVSARVRVVRFGMSDGASLVLQLHAFESPRVELRDLDLTGPTNLQVLRAWGEEQPTFVVMDDPPFFPGRKQDLQPVFSLLRPIFRAEKPGGKRAVMIYEVAGRGRAGLSAPFRD